MKTPMLMIVALALMAAACGANAMGPPEIVVDRTVCSHCGMFVSEPAYAAAYQAGASDPRVFDDIGCMLDAVRRETASPITFWLQDAAGGGWMAATAATIVSSPEIRTPMSGGLVAYADAAAARRAAAARSGEVLGSFRELLQRKGAAR